jgi:hypothetical protein
VDERLGVLEPPAAAVPADRPDAEEVLVERARFLRFAEAEGRTGEVLAQLSRFAA